MKPSTLVPIKTDTFIVDSCGSKLLRASGFGLRATSYRLRASGDRLLAALGSKCSLRFPQPVERSARILGKRAFGQNLQVLLVVFSGFGFISEFFLAHGKTEADRKSTRLNSSHLGISY